MQIKRQNRENRTLNRFFEKHEWMIKSSSLSSFKPTYIYIRSNARHMLPYRIHTNTTQRQRYAVHITPFPCGADRDNRMPQAFYPDIAPSIQPHFRQFHVLLTCRLFYTNTPRHWKRTLLLNTGFYSTLKTPFLHNS